MAEVSQARILLPTVSMNVRLYENIDTADTVKVDFYIFVLVPITHPIQCSAMHVVLFVACTSHRS